MNKLHNPTPPLAAAATSASGDGKKPILSPIKVKVLYYSSSAIGLLCIAIAILWGLEAPVWFGFAFLIIAVLLEPRSEPRHPVAEVVRLRASPRTVVVPVVTDQDGETLIGVTRVFQSGELLEETNWKATALEREELLEHYGLIGIAARGAV